MVADSAAIETEEDLEVEVVADTEATAEALEEASVVVGTCSL